MQGEELGQAGNDVEPREGGGRRNAQPTRQGGLDVLQELGFHARQGQARAGQTVLVLTGADQTQTYLESTEAISPHGIALGSRQYGQAGV
jgi:hypothetical protein